MVKVVVKEVGKELEVREVAKVDLKFMQTVVDGYIEMPCMSRALSGADVDIVINEEGKLIGLEENIAIMQGHKVIEMLVGNVVFVGHDGRGNNIGLKDEQIELIKKVISNGAVYKGSEIIKVGMMQY